MIPISRLRPGRLHKKSDPTSNWLIIFLVWAAGLGAAAQFGKIAVSLDEFRTIYSVGEVGLGFLISCVGLVGLVFGVAGGILIPLIGIRRAFVWGMFGAAVLSALQAVHLPYFALIVLRILEGASHLLIVVAGPILMARHSSIAARGAVMTLWSSFFGLSYMLVALIAPALLTLGGTSALFVAHAGYMCVLGVALWRVLPPPVVTDSAQRTKKPLDLATILRLHVTIYTSPWLSAAALGFVFYTGLYIALLTYLPDFVDTVQRTGLSASLPLASIVTSLTLGVVMLRFIDPVRAVIIGYVLIAVSAVPLIFTLGQDAVFIVACLVLLGATGIVPGASFALLASLNADETDRAYATGAIAQLGNLGTTTGPPILAAIIAQFGLSGTVAFVMLFSACGISIHLFLAGRRSKTMNQRD